MAIALTHFFGQGSHVIDARARSLEKISGCEERAQKYAGGQLANARQHAIGMCTHEIDWTSYIKRVHEV